MRPGSTGPCGVDEPDPQPASENARDQTGESSPHLRGLVFVGVRIASTTAAAPPRNAVAVASRANDAGSDEMTTPCQKTLSDPSPSAAATTPTTIAAHVRSDRSPSSNAAAASSASSAADPTSIHCARLAIASPVAKAALAASAPAAATPATAAAVSARRRGTARANAASAAERHEPRDEPRPYRRPRDARERPRQLRPATVERKRQRPGCALARHEVRAGGDSRWSCHKQAAPGRQAHPAGAAPHELVRRRTRRRAVDPDAVRPEAQERLAEQSEHEQPVRRVDAHAKRTVAVDDLRVHAGKRRARELEAIVERHRRRTRMRGRAAGSHETGENGDGQRSEAHTNLRLLDENVLRTRAEAARAARTARASGRAGRRDT